MSEASRPVRSMTGFARVRRETPCGELVISIKSLNHRGLDIRFHIPPDLEPFENELRTRLTKRMRRGHADVRIHFNRTTDEEAIGLNPGLLKAYMKAYRQAAEECGVEAQPDLGQVLRTPGMLSEPADREIGPEVRDALFEGIESALRELNGFREREGGQLAGDIQTRLVHIKQAAVRMKEIRSKAVPAFQQRLKQRLSDLLNGTALEPQRLAQEAAVLADRSDVGEELARLDIHAGQLEAMLADGGEIGKRIDFLLQEMHRETNTILSKTNGIGEIGLEITDLALATKSNIEKIREQSLNLE